MVKEKTTKNLATILENEIVGIKVTVKTNTLLLVKSGDYKLYLEQSGIHWRFVEDKSTPIFINEHFDLRYQIHNKLNHKHIFKLMQNV